MTILVTGVTGFIGSHIARDICKEKPNEEIRFLIRKNKVSEELQELNARIIKGNLHDKNSLRKALRGINTVLHVAAETGENMSAEEYNYTNVEGTRNLLEIFSEAKGEKFIHTSAVGVYGYDLPNKPINEDYPKKASFPYHVSKLLSEQLVFKMAEEHSFKAAAVRPPMVMGPGDFQVVPAIFKFILEGKKIPLINGGTKTKTSFAHVRDVTRALFLCIDNEEAYNEAFNVVSFTTTQKNLFDTAAEIAGLEPNYLRIKYGLAYVLGFFSEVIAKITRNKKPKITRRRVNQIGRTRVYDTGKIEEKLSFKSKYNLFETLEESFHWMKRKNLV